MTTEELIGLLLTTTTSSTSILVIVLISYINSVEANYDWGDVDPPHRIAGSLIAGACIAGGSAVVLELCGIPNISCLFLQISLISAVSWGTFLLIVQIIFIIAGIIVLVYMKIWDN